MCAEPETELGLNEGPGQGKPSLPQVPSAIPMGTKHHCFLLGPTPNPKSS